MMRAYGGWARATMLASPTLVSPSRPPAPLLASLLSLAGARKIRRGQSAPQEDSAKLCKSTAASCAAQLKLMHQLSAQGMAREGARMAEATMLREVTEEVPVGVARRGYVTKAEGGM